MSAAKTWTPFSAGLACVQRVDHGEARSMTLDEAVEQVQHPLAGLGRPQLIDVIAYLACQVVGYQHSQNADANLAMSQICRIVSDFDRRSASSRPPASGEQTP